MKILIAGDFCPQHRVAELFEKGDFSTVLGEVQTIIKHSDYSIVNYECPVCNGTEKPIIKIGPNLKCSKSGIEAIQWAGFNCVTLANNHFRDYGQEGIEQTTNLCQAQGIETVGGGRTLAEARNTLLINRGLSKVAIINVCENEWSIATDIRGGSNPINPIRQYYDIKEAKQEADFVIVIVHGGTEWYNLPTPRMKETYRFFIETGADAVINHHQHCYSGYELFQGKPIFYGLGNFCFDKGAQNKIFWHEGYMVMLDLHEEKIDFTIIPYEQCAAQPTIHVLDDRTEFDLEIQKLNLIIADDKLLQDSFHRLSLSRKRGIYNILSPYSSRLLKRLQIHGIIPAFVTKNKLISVLSKIQCEAHRDILLEFLKTTVE